MSDDVYLFSVWHMRALLVNLFVLCAALLIHWALGRWQARRTGH